MAVVGYPKPAIPSGVQERLDKSRYMLNLLKLRYDAKAGQIMSMRDDSFTILKSYDLMTQGGTRMIAKGGFHPRNRSKRGLTPANVPLKVESFKATGFSAAACRPVVVGRVPGEWGDAYEQANIDLCNAPASKEMLCPVTSGILESFTLICNHSWQALKLGSLDSTIDHREYKYLGLASAISDGIQVDDIHWAVEVEHPWLIDLIIEADNIVAQASNSDSSMDLCYKIQGLASELVDSRGKPDWDSILIRLKRTEFRAVDDLPHYIDMVNHCFLGNDLLQKLDAFAKTLKVVQPFPIMSLAKLGSVWLGPEGCPLFTEGVFKACMRAPSKHIINNQNVFFTSADAIALGKSHMLPFVQAADASLEQARALASTLVQGDATKKQELLDACFVRTASHILKRPIQGEFKSIGAIGGQFYSDMSMLVGQLETPMPNSWTQPGSEASKALAKKASSKKGDVAVGASSSTQKNPIVAHFNDKGLEVGSLVLEKVSKDKYEITRIKGDKISLKAVDGGETRESLTSLFLSLYEQTSVPKEADAPSRIHTYIYIYSFFYLSAYID